MNTVIVGVDGSETATQAALRALQLAAHAGAALHVVTAYGNSRAETALGHEADQWLRAAGDQAEETAASVAEGLRQEAPDVAVTSGAVHGKPHVALIAEASRLDAELIVVGNRRMQGMQRVLGSIASAVAHRAPCDVYIVNTIGQRG